MGRISFENYGERAKLSNNYTVIAGRYSIQKEAEKYIFLDVISKLNINPKDKCLDIGCGAGNILIPLSFLVKEITGIDHSLVIEKLKKRFPNSNKIKLISGNFLDLKIDKIYNKILVYSVLHYLADEKEVLEFIDKTVSLLAPGGKILFGDIPNKSKKEKFLLSQKGKEFINEWEHKLSFHQKNDKSEASLLDKLKKDENIVEFDDIFILKIIKKLRNCNLLAYILPQPPELPFGYTREDILVEKL